MVFGYYLGFFAFGAMLARHRDLLAGYGRRWVALLAVANLVVLPGMLKLTVSGNWLEEEFGPRSPDWLPAWKAAAIDLSEAGDDGRAAEVLVGPTAGPVGDGDDADADRSMTGRRLPSARSG